MYLEVRVGAHRKGRQTDLDHLWGDPGRGIVFFWGGGLYHGDPEMFRGEPEMFH